METISFGRSDLRERSQWAALGRRQDGGADVWRSLRKKDCLSAGEAHPAMERQDPKR